MTNYVEPTLRTRQLFFLAVATLGGFALFISRLDVFLPAIRDPNQISTWLLASTVISSLFYISLAVAAIYYTRRAVQSGQWPAKGMTVPFRTKIMEIKNPKNAWLLLTVMLCFLIIKIALPWVMYAKQLEMVEEIKQLNIRSEGLNSKGENPSNPSLKQN
jgi:hypothetical protein